MWKISKAWQPDSYLLGTVHYGKKGAAANPKLAKLVDRSQKVITKTGGNLPPEKM